MELSAVSPALDGIEKALAVYPAGFVSTLCKAIFICGSLTLGGAEAGGSYGPNWLVLVATEKVGVKGIFETAHLGVHHELSSLVWSAAADFPARWVALLPPDWSPAQTNAEALAAAREEPIERNDGFLSAYAATTTENDFNTFAETAFAAPARLAAAAARVPLVARKAALLVDTYCRLDPRFVSVFAGLGLGHLRDARLLESPPARAIAPVDVPSGVIVRPLEKSDR